MINYTVHTPGQKNGTRVNVVQFEVFFFSQECVLVNSVKIDGDYFILNVFFLGAGGGELFLICHCYFRMHDGFTNT